jgi:hypothetical protein
VRYCGKQEMGILFWTVVRRPLPCRGISSLTVRNCLCAVYCPTLTLEEFHPPAERWEVDCCLPYRVFFVRRS